jgi:mono/diheme cytochrome c family protein
MIRSLLVLSALTLAGTSFAADKKVERLFNSKCGSCHGKDGKAQTENGKKMHMREMGSEDFQKVSDEDMKKAINDGVKREKDGVKQEMDAFKDDLKPADVDALVKMSREFKK